MRSSKFFRGTLIVLGLWLLLYTIFVAPTISIPTLIVGMVFLGWGSINKFWASPTKSSAKSVEDEDSDDEDSDDEECYGVEHKFCFFSKNYYTNRILETSGIRKIVYSIMSKECEETIPYWANLVFRRRTKGLWPDLRKV